ncbi:MAG: Sjogren's syndrome/scleroderma autoantigen 1 family protein [Candidatus Bathyarchaeia archaeon]
MAMRDADFKRMAELLKLGASMLNESCPECKVPLFKLKEDVFCPLCNRKFILVKSDEELSKATADLSLRSLEKIAVSKLEELGDLVSATTNPDKQFELVSLISMWLDVLGKLRSLTSRKE